MEKIKLMKYYDKLIIDLINSGLDSDIIDSRDTLLSEIAVLCSNMRNVMHDLINLVTNNYIDIVDNRNIISANGGYQITALIYASKYAVIDGTTYFNMLISKDAGVDIRD